MMESLKTWIIGITVASMLLGAADTMVTQSGIKRVLRLAGGILLLIVLLGPLAGISGGEVAFTSAGLQQEAEALEEQFRQEQQNTLAAIIAEEVSAYISDKAQTMGISCEVRVETEVGGEGVFYGMGAYAPERARMNALRRHLRLAPEEPEALRRRSEIT